jgi:hypothetical protein
VTLDDLKASAERRRSGKYDNDDAEWLDVFRLASFAVRILEAIPLDAIQRQEAWLESNGDDEIYDDPTEDFFEDRNAIVEWAIRAAKGGGS